MFWKKPKLDVAPQWIIVGLGNPGGEYRGTRHNIGWEVIDNLSEKFRIKMDKSKHRAGDGIGLVKEIPVMLVKPLTYMNLSGQAVAPLMREAQLTPDKVLVIADDMDLDVGKLRLKLKGSAGGHNGHKSLIHSLHTQDYPRLKIGIGHGGAGNIDHVLGAFDQQERAEMETKLRVAVETVAVFISEGENAALRVLETGNR